jgi:hypothetical protein
MSVHRTLLFGAVALALAGCNPFHRSPAVEVSATDVNLNSRWHGSMASPSTLAGVVQISGSATMAPGDAARTTHVTLDLTNATPGGVHPWGLHRGQCDDDQGLIGQRSEYQSVEIGNDGRANGSANIDLDTPTTGRYSVRVTASAQNTNRIVACANLAPPSM